MGAELPALFSPITLRSVQARNRIVTSPMCQYCSFDGMPWEWQLVEFGKYAVGGAGIVFGEETKVEPRGRSTYDDAGIWDDRHIAGFRRITNFIRQMGAVPAIQLGHSGRKAAMKGPLEDRAPLGLDDAGRARPAWPTISASAIPDQPHQQIPKEMDREDIATVVKAWGEGARRGLEAGYDICEIHGAHGYLIQQFLSPVSNRRTDAYGGDLEGRMRLALEITEAVRRQWPEDKPLFFRVSSVDGPGGEWTMDDTVTLAGELRLRGVDVIDCSSGGIRGGSSELPIVPRVPGHQVGYSRRVKEMCGISTMAVGLITDPRHANDIVSQGHADLVALARGVMDDPNWPYHAAKVLGLEDPFSVLPPHYAFRLSERERTSSGYPAGCEVRIPFSETELEGYTWPPYYLPARV